MSCTCARVCVVQPIVDLHFCQCKGDCNTKNCNIQMIKCTGKNDHARRAAHREAVSRTVIHSIFDAWHYAVLWTCAVTGLL